MLTMQPITDSLYAFIGNDRRLTQFENMFQLFRGVSYNSYLILDEKTAVIDCVDQAVADSFFHAVADQLGDRTLDYIICNHVEPDHCATIDDLMIRHPEAKLVISALGLRLLTQFFQHPYGDRVIVTEEGNTLSLGKHVLETITAPHVHWPEVTFTYEQTEGWLFSADAFGSFGSLEGQLFADQVDYERDWIDEARRYYVNIVGRQGPHVLKALDKVSKRCLKGVFPVHGLLYRELHDITRIVDKYQHWAAYRPEEAGVVICYGSMYENSAHTADELAFRLGRLGVQQIRVFDVSETDVSLMTAELFRFSHAIFFCNNYNTELFPKMDNLLRELMMLHWDNHSYSIVGNGSWGGRAVPMAKEILGQGKGLVPVAKDFVFKSRPAPADLPKLQKFAEEVAVSVEAFGSTLAEDGEGLVVE